MKTELMKKSSVYFECFIQIVIFYSLITYFIELELGCSENSREGQLFYLWSERTVAAIFTIEYLIRWYFSKKLFYPFSPLAIIDLAAVLPFYIGFLVDMRALRLIRTLRILRILKFYRYNDAMRRFILSYKKVQHELYVLGTAVIFLVFLSGTIIYEAERKVQPDMFAKYSDGLWWSLITLTTVGYGDKYPITTAGRLTACVTLMIGLGLFASFISLMGSSFASTFNEDHSSIHIHVSLSNVERITRIIDLPKHSISESKVNDIIEEALSNLQNVKLDNRTCEIQEN
jgi:voltage-gated potassium channel